MLCVCLLSIVRMLVVVFLFMFMYVVLFMLLICGDRIMLGICWNGCGIVIGLILKLLRLVVCNWLFVSVLVSVVLLIKLLCVVLMRIVLCLKCVNVLWLSIWWLLVVNG